MLAWVDIGWTIRLGGLCVCHCCFLVCDKLYPRVTHIRHSIYIYTVLSVLAAPLQDVSVTSVDLAEESVNNKGDEHLFVTVTRVDDLVDDDGSILAERVMAVRVTFDVLENQVKSYENIPTSRNH